MTLEMSQFFINESIFIFIGYKEIFTHPSRTANAYSRGLLS